MDFMKWFTKRTSGAHLGIEITDHMIKMVEMNWSHESPLVEKWCIEPLSEGLIEDGRIKQTDAVVESLQQVLNKHDIRTKSAHFSLPSQLAMIRFMKLPNLPKNELKKMIDFEVNHNMHLPFEQTVYDFIRFEKQTENVKVQSSKFVPKNMGDSASSPPERECEIMLVASAKATVEEYKNVITLAGLSLKSIEVKALSMYRMLASKQTLNLRSSFMTIDIGETNTDIHIFQNGQLKTSRSIPISFVVQKAQVNEELEVINGFYTDYSTSSSQFDSGATELLHETDRLLNFYRHRLSHDQEPVSAIIISGELERLDTLVTQLRSEFGEAPIARLGNEGFSAVPDERFSALVIPIGLALRGNQM